MGRNEKMLLEEVLSAVDAYDMHRCKNGLTIQIQVIDKDSGSCGCTRESFRDVNKAVKYLEEFRKQEESE